MSAKRVLIVDDDPALLDALPETLHLRMPGVAVDTADSAPAAIERIAATDYDAIVTDIKMPGVDGLALLAEIRRRRPGTPTLLITGHGEHDLAVQALRGGAYDYIPKPIDREYFVMALGRALHVRADRFLGGGRGEPHGRLRLVVGSPGGTRQGCTITRRTRGLYVTLRFSSFLVPSTKRISRVT